MSSSSSSSSPPSPPRFSPRFAFTTYLLSTLLCFFPSLFFHHVVVTAWVIPSPKSIPPTITRRWASSPSSPNINNNNDDDVIPLIQQPQQARRVMKLIEKMKTSMEAQDFQRPLWEAIVYEATSITDGDLKAGSLMSNFVVSQPTFEDAVIDFVANQLETPLFQATQIRNLFAEACLSNPQMSSMWALDLMAAAMRDKSQANAVSVLLFNKGFHSLVTYRVAHTLWYGGRDGLARYFQSLGSRTFGSDIHPACKMGVGIVVSSATGIVIGETAVLGNDCMISHDVTLGGTGKQSGDRHPKLGNGVFVGAGATILGNIPIGDGAVVNSGAVVTKPVETFSRVGGVPAKLIAVFTPQADNFDIAQRAYRAEDYATSDGCITKDVGMPQLYLDYHKQNGIR